MHLVRFRSFAEFWPFYVGEHAKPLTRKVHFLGTTGGLACALAALVQGDPLWLAGAPLIGYGCAWVSHFFIEKNRPATFRYPLYSLAGDFFMYQKMWLGQMDVEVARVIALERAAS